MKNESFVAVCDQDFQIESNREPKKQINFFDETINFFKKNDINLDDVSHVSINNKSLAFLDFLVMIKPFDYDNGFGTHYVNLDLIIHLKDFSMVIRDEHDGREKFKLYRYRTFDEGSKINSIDEIKADYLYT